MKGSVKGEVGDVVGNYNLRAEGEAQQSKGKEQTAETKAPLWRRSMRSRPNHRPRSRPRSRKRFWLAEAAWKMSSTSGGPTAWPQMS